MPIELFREYSGIDIDRSKLELLVDGVCSRFGSEGAGVSIAVLDDEEIRKVNAEFLDHDWSTDVISFDLSDEGDGAGVFELIVNGEMAVREGGSRGHSGEAEFALYVVHGLLHNFGFDDSEDGSGERMHKMEDEILQHGGYGIIYGSGSNS